jgi:glucokinase
MMVEDLGSKRGTVAAVGVAIPGLVHRETDRVIAPRELTSAMVEDLHGQLTRATGLRVELENDANAAAYGEYKVGAGHGARNMFYMMIGNGIGGAIILDGKLWTGASGFAGEVGHITIDSEGLECVCGNTGCLETVASAPSIVRRARERLYRDNTSSLSRLGLNKSFTADDVAHQANEGDDFALMMIERTGKYIGTGVASVINLLNIERIVLGGGVMDAGSLIRDRRSQTRTRRRTHRRGPARSRRLLRLIPFFLRFLCFFVVQFEFPNPFGKVPSYFAINIMSAKGCRLFVCQRYRFD